jgi:antitoxin component HigA of HigAB toxin-antitoxin module
MESTSGAAMKRPDWESLEEMSLAMAQAEIQIAMDESGLKKSELADKLGRPRSFISRILSGNHNLTIRTMARVFGACGFEIRFQRAPKVSP